MARMSPGVPTAEHISDGYAGRPRIMSNGRCVKPPIGTKIGTAAPDELPARLAFIR